MLATGGLPITGTPVAAASITSVETAGLQTTGMSAGLLGATTARSSATPLSAPMTATVTFESRAFRAVPRRVVTPAKVAAVVRVLPTRHTPTETAPARPVAKVAPVHKPAAPAKKGTSDTSKSDTGKSAAAPSTARKHVAAPVKKTPVKRTKHAETPPKGSNDTAAPKKSRHVAPPRPVKHDPAPKQPHAKKPQVKKKHQAPAGSARGSSVLAVAARYVGTPYIYGGTTPRGFDCSGYVGYVYRQLGVRLPRTANQQMHATHRVSRSQARPGDLVFFVSGSRAYHVGIYAGGGKMYDSPRTGKTIQKRAIWSASVVFGRVTR
jgi:cell wall-associated NlpC family hydrolase